MSNMFYLIGYIVSELQINEIENRKVSIITLAVTRSYQNEYGLYDTDFIDVALFGDIAKNVKEFCKKGDLVGVAGRIEKLKDEEIKLIADKANILSSAK